LIAYHLPPTLKRRKGMDLKNYWLNLGELISIYNNSITMKNFYINNAVLESRRWYS